jgi:hypothetical protein
MTAMSKIRLFAVLTILLAAIAISAAVWAAVGDADARDYQRQDERRGMTGLPGVIVFVGEPGESLQKVGVTQALVQSKVELRLRRLGIRVLSEDEWLLKTEARFPQLSINVMGIEPSGRGDLAVSVHVRLIQTVQLLGTYAKIQGATWDRLTISSGGRQRCKEGVVSRIEDYIDEFGNDFLAANAAPSTRQSRER